MDSRGSGSARPEAAVRRTGWKGWVWAAPILVALGIYVNTLDGEFVFDDRSQILENPWVQDLAFLPETLTHSVWDFKYREPSNYFRPLQMASYNLLWAASAGSPWVFHLLNVVLHGLTTATLALLIRRISGDPALALAAAMLFAVHPIHTEPVAWIAGLPELGYSCFALIALLLQVASWDARGRSRSRRVGAVAAFAVALLFKETAVVVIPLVFLAEWRLRGSRDRRRSRWLAATARALPFGLVVPFYLLVRAVALGGLAPETGSNLPLAEVIWTSPSLLLSYTRQAVFPAGLLVYHVDEPVRSAAALAFIGPTIALAGILGLLAWITRSRPDLRFALALALLPLLPALYVAKYSEVMLSERYTYLPSAGVVWLIAAGLLCLARRLAPGYSTRLAAVLLLALVLPAGVQTLRRNRDWHDDARLARSTLRLEPRAREIWFMLGSSFESRDDFAGALHTYRDALRIFPGDPELRATAVHAELQLHRLSAEEAIRRYLELSAEMETPYWLWVHLGNARLRSGDAGGARRDFERALELFPSYAPARRGLQLARIALGDTEAADPASTASAGDDLVRAAALLEAGRVDEADAVYREILASNALSLEALIGRSEVASRRGQHEASVAFCERALEVDPANLSALGQMGLAEMRLGRIGRAIRTLERARSIAPEDKKILNTLGVAYARSGRDDEAREAWRHALAIDPDYESARRNLERLQRE
jgi:tetratricopeptide (TPR) repeat protein